MEKLSNLKLFLLECHTPNVRSAYTKLLVSLLHQSFVHNPIIEYGPSMLIVLFFAGKFTFSFLLVRHEFANIPQTKQHIS